MPDQQLARFLDAAPWYGHLPAAERARVASEIGVKQLAAGSYLCHREENPVYWYGVIDGLLKICMTGVAGESITFTGVPAGGWFGEGTVVKQMPLKYDVAALRDSTVAMVPADTFLRLYETDLAFNHFVIAQLNERLGQFISTFAANRTLTVEERVTHAIAWMFNDQLYPGGDRQLNLSQEEIANLVGVSRPRCNQALKRLKDAGLLDIGYGVITIRDLAGLRAFAA